MRLEFGITCISDVYDTGWAVIGQVTKYRAANGHGAYAIYHTEYDDGREEVEIYHQRHSERLADSCAIRSVERAKTICREHAAQVVTGQLALF